MGGAVANDFESYNEDIKSSGSFLSKTSSKFEVDPLDEKEDDDMKSQFESSSSEEEEDANRFSAIKDKLKYLSQNT